jgi:hypothetical protein
LASSKMFSGLISTSRFRDSLVSQDSRLIDPTTMCNSLPMHPRQSRDKLHEVEMGYIFWHPHIRLCSLPLVFGLEVGAMRHQHQPSLTDLVKQITASSVLHRYPKPHIIFSPGVKRYQIFMASAQSVQLNFEPQLSRAYPTTIQSVLFVYELYRKNTLFGFPFLHTIGERLVSTRAIEQHSPRNSRTLHTPLYQSFLI